MNYKQLNVNFKNFKYQVTRDGKIFLYPLQITLYILLMDENG